MIDTSEILISKTHIEPLRDDGYVIYPVAYIGPVVGGKREAYSKGGNIKGGSAITPHIGENGNWYIGTTDTGVKAAGTDGTNGTNGVGIASIELISTVGRAKTYRITFTNSNTFDFVVTDGADGTPADTSVFQVHIRFEVVGAKEFECPYACKFTAMINQQTNAPTLSTALDTNLAQYDILTVTADAVGMVTLTGTWL